MDVLACPSCKSTLRVFPFEEEHNPIRPTFQATRCSDYCGLMQALVKDLTGQPDCNRCYETEIRNGILTCRCGVVFPIVNRIPRCLESGLGQFSDFREKHREEIEKALHETTGLDPIKGESIAKEFLSIHDSFSEEWSFFKYESDKTWGWDTEDRKRVFLSEIGLEADSLEQKLLLDAGCGNGILSALLTEFGLEVVGVDISESVVRADSQKEEFAKGKAFNVHFAQGNLFGLPFKPGSFDIIYSSGVLHHCPDTRDTFLKIIPFVKPNGRVYIWVYGKRGFFVSAFMWHGRFLRKHISLKTLFRYCQALAPFYKVMTRALSALHVYEFRPRNTREITLDLFDAFSPQYNHPHTQAEVLGWFREHGFAQAAVCGVSKHGFGVRGDKV
jgi:SAM-dependent methyltransferase/uncharacterized protein YbaR (Trm112 family)